jgi:hypothetical protein
MDPYRGMTSSAWRRRIVALCWSGRFGATGSLLVMRYFDTAVTESFVDMAFDRGVRSEE